METRRRIASWVLLAVFLPMLLLSSLHVHETPTGTQNSCEACVDHHCGGHFGQQTLPMHQCLLCEFLSLPILLAAVVAIVHCFRRVSPLFCIQINRRTHRICGVLVPRAPPVV